MTVIQRSKEKRNERKKETEEKYKKGEERHRTFNYRRNNVCPYLALLCHYVPHIPTKRLKILLCKQINTPITGDKQQYNAGNGASEAETGN